MDILKLELLSAFSRITDFVNNNQEEVDIERYKKNLVTVIAGLILSCDSEKEREVFNLLWWLGIAPDDINVLSQTTNVDVTYYRTFFENRLSSALMLDIENLI